jgi:hypothetical protein
LPAAVLEGVEAAGDLVDLGPVCMALLRDSGEVGAFWAGLSVTMLLVGAAGQRGAHVVLLGCGGVGVGAMVRCKARRSRISSMVRGGRLQRPER